MKPLNILAKATLAISLLAGCGSKFSAQKTSDPLQAQSVIGGGNPGDPGVVDTPVGDVNVPGVINDPVGALDDLKSVGMKLALPYGVLSKPMESILTDALNQYVRVKDCDKVGTAQDTRPAGKQYRCGEIPFGDIISDSKKFVYQVGIPSTWGSQDGTNFWIGQGSTQLFLSRYQKQGSISIELLDNKTGTQTVTTLNELGKNIFVKLAPKSGTLEAGLCFTVPGSEITSGGLWLPANINRTVLWVFDFNTDLSINIDMGKAQFDSIKSCVSVQASYDKKTGVPTVKVTAIEQPQFQNLNLNGFQVKTDASVNGFLGVVINVLDFFGAGIKQMIANAVNQEVTKQFNQQANVTTAQVTSGEWMLSMLHYDYLKPLLVDNINKAMESSKDVSGKFELPVGQWLGAACLTLIDKYASQQNVVTLNELYTLCKGIPQIQLNAFLDDSEMSAKGCYSRFFSVETLVSNPSVWWASQCTIKNEVVVTAPGAMIPVIQCLADAVNSNFTKFDQCKPFLDDLVARLKNGDFDNYLKSAAVVDPYMTDFNSIMTTIQDLAKQYLGYNFAFTYDPLLLASQLAQTIGIIPSMSLDQITTAGTKNISVMNVDVANAQNLLQALIDRKKAGTAPDVIMVQNANTDAARKFIKDIAYPYIAMGPTKSGYANDAGIAILSKYNIIQSSTFSYGQSCLGSACNNNQGIIHARIKIDGVPHPIEVVNTQLQSLQAAKEVNLQNLLDTTQNKQLVDLAGYMIANALTDLPLIVGGDFESTVSSRIYQQLMYFLKSRNGGKECADLTSCIVSTGSQRYELWFDSFDHQFIRNSAKIAMKVVQGQRAFKTTDLTKQISNGGALEMTYQLSWKP